MSIATAIQNAQGKVANAYTAVSNKGGTLPATQDLSNLPNAIISIPEGMSSVVASSVIVGDSSGIFNSSGNVSSLSSALNYGKSYSLQKGKTYYVKGRSTTNRYIDAFTITVS